MDNDHLASQQLVLNFEEDKQEAVHREEQPPRHLALVIDNSCTRAPAPVFQLEPNSLEVTNIIRSLGRSLSW